MAPKLTVVVPCYNESANIPLFLERFAKLSKQDNLSLLIVDNGSTDRTTEILHSSLPKYGFAQSYRVPVNQGYGYGILKGLEQCDSEFLGWTHADMQTDPFDLVRAFEVIENADFSEDVYVKGLRRGRPPFDSFFTAGMSIFESVYLGSSLWDINAQPNVFHRSFFEKWDAPPRDFSLDLYAFYQARKLKLNVKRLDVVFPERIHGESKWNTGFQSKLRFIRRTIEFSVRLKKTL